MEPTRHCDLCDHQRTSFKDGIICGLTERKPEFNRLCSRSSFDFHLKQELRGVHSYHEILMRSRTKHYLKTTAAFGISATLLIAGTWLILKYGVEIRSLLYFSLSLIGSAVYPLYWAFNDFVKFKQELTVAQKKINQIDEVLALYRITYDIQHKIEEIFYGEYKMSTEVTLRQ
jgi:hypothetical protein